MKNYRLNVLELQKFIIFLTCTEMTCRIMLKLFSCISVEDCVFQKLQTSRKNIEYDS